MKKILGFVGHIGSGKGIACDYIRSRYNSGYYKYSTVLRDLLSRLYLPIDRDHLVRMSETVRKEFGEDTLARVIKEDAVRDPHNIVCVDGIRRLADIVELQKIPGFVLIHVEADLRTRYKRITERAENAGDATKTFEEFLADEERTTEKTIDEVTSIAPHTITNNGTIAELYAQLDALIQTLP